MRRHQDSPGRALYPINEFGAEIFEFAARHRAVVLSHSSEQNSLASDLVEWADRFPEMTLILAHLGWGWDGDYTHQVRGMQRSRQGNVFTDTSSTGRSLPGSLNGRSVKSVPTGSCLARIRPCTWPRCSESALTRQN